MRKTAIRSCLFVPTLLSLALSCFAATPVYYATFGLGYGARALAMGGAFIAIADDITATNYNPAGLAQLLFPEFSLGTRYGGQRYDSSGYDISIDSTDRYVFDPYQASYNRFLWDYFGGVVPIKIGKITVVLGISSSVKGSDAARYSYLNHLSNFMLPEDIKRSELFQSVNVDISGSINVASFSIAVRPLEFLYLGYNLNYWNKNNFRHDRWQDENIGYYPSSWDVTISDDVTRTERFDEGFNSDFGMMLKFRYASLGFIYRTAFNADYSSVEDFTESPGALHWPYSYGVGVAIRPSDMITLSADYNFANWSAGKVVYDDGTERPYPASYNASDTKQMRVGIEYLLSRAQPAVPIRLGFFTNKLFWNDWQGQPIRFKGLTCGTGVTYNKMSIDLAAIYNYGSYDVLALMIANTFYTVAVKESNWEVLLSISFRLTK